MRGCAALHFFLYSQSTRNVGAETILRSFPSFFPFISSLSLTHNFLLLGCLLTCAKLHGVAVRIPAHPHTLVGLNSFHTRLQREDGAFLIRVRWYGGPVPLPFGAGSPATPPAFTAGQCDDSLIHCGFWLTREHWWGAPTPLTYGESAGESGTPPVSSRGRSQATSFMLTCGCTLR